MESTGALRTSRPRRSEEVNVAELAEEPTKVAQPPVTDFAGRSHARRRAAVFRLDKRTHVFRGPVPRAVSI